MFQLDGKLLQEQYAVHLSGYTSWNQGEHAQNWIIYPENMGEYLSLDETCLTNGDLFTILTNKAANGKKGALIALVKGTVSDTVIDILHKIPEFQRKKVKEITLDLAPTMERIAKRSFPKAKLVSDRFHVQKLASDAVQEIRIKHRWAAIEQENQEIEYAKELKKKYVPEILENGDTLKQLLVRSRFLLYKRESKWSASQVYRAEILFRLYPDLKEAYKQSMELFNIFTHSQNRLVAFKKLALWYNSIEKLELKSFNTIAKTIMSIS